MQLHILNRPRLYLFLGIVAVSILIATAVAGQEPPRRTDIPDATILNTNNLPSLVIPFIDARRGRKLFGAKDRHPGQSA
jgi:hypothetical protein